MFGRQVSNLTRGTWADTSGQFHVPDKSFKLLLKGENVSVRNLAKQILGSIIPLSYIFIFGSSVGAL